MRKYDTMSVLEVMGKYMSCIRDLSVCRVVMRVISVYGCERVMAVCDCKSHHCYTKKTVLASQ